MVRSARVGVVLAALGVLGAASCEGAVETGQSAEDVKSAKPRVELKVTLRADQIEDARAALHLDDGDAEDREVTFYDTLDLDLTEAGIVLRARKIDGDDDDSTVKLRPMASSEVDADWLEVEGFKCEIDRAGDTSMESCSLQATQDRGEIDDVAAGERGIDKLFSEEQEDFLAEHASTPVDWSALEVLGPVEAQVWEIEVDGFGETLDVELWALPDGTEILEVSTKVKAGDADDAAQELAQLLEDLGLDASTTQETKTRATLEYFSGSP